MSAVHFALIDYFLFSIVFIVSIAIGLYFAFRSKVQTVDEYFFGVKKLSVLPVAFSLLATTISGSTSIGQSMEVYAYGLHASVYVILILIWAPLAHFIFLPVFYELQLKSSFVYLELRFDKSVKLIASSLFVVTGFFLIPMTIYVPALALQEVTGLNLYLICIVSGGLCVLYTAIGGFTAVVWSDFVQFSLILISTSLIFVVGLVSIGGFKNTWNALDRGGRSQIFKTDFSLETRGSLWAYLFSAAPAVTYNVCLTQSCIQRYLSLPSLKKAKQAVWIQAFFCANGLLMHTAIGAVIYATYENCDPIKANLVKKIDQIFPYFVQEKALFSGFNGIFIAGVFAAGLSTTSTLLNTMSGTIYVDFLSKKMENISQQNSHRIIKIIVALIGIIGIGLIYVIERLGTVFAITSQCFTISAVGVFGLYCNGMFFRNINSKGAKSGVLLAMIALGILMTGSFNKSPDPVLPLRTDGCEFSNSTISINFLQQTTISSNASSNNNELSWIFRINFQFFCIIGLIINITVANIVSFLTGGNKVRDQRLLVPFLRKNIERIPEDIPLSPI